MGWPYQQKPPMGWPIDLDHPLSDFVAFWPMWEGSGGQVFDLSGNGRTAVPAIAGQPILWRPGISGPAIEFENTFNDDLVPGYSAVNGQDVTIITRFKVTAVTDNNAVCGFSTGYRIYVDTSNNARFRGTNFNLVIGTAPTNEWVTVAGTLLDTTEAKCYFNGNFTGVDAAITGVTASTFNIGSYGLGNDPFQGLIDYVMVWDRVLSASEIALLYREPFCMFKDPAEMLLNYPWGGAPPGTILPQITNAYMKVSA